MRIYVAGRKAFGAAALELCLSLGHEVVGVSAPAFGGRAGSTRSWFAYGDERPDRLRALAERHGVPWLEAGDLRAETLPKDVDLIVAAHAYDFIGRRTLRKARLGGIGYHPSLLPLHRGRDAVRWTVMMGDKVTGGTVYWLSDGVDCGPIAAQDWCHVRPGDDAETLWRRDLFPMGLRLFAKALTDIESGRLIRVKQDNALATWEPSWERAPIVRPDLPLLGTVAGYSVTADPNALHAAAPHA